MIDTFHKIRIPLALTMVTLISACSYLPSWLQPGSDLERSGEAEVVAYDATINSSDVQEAVVTNQEEFDSSTADTFASDTGEIGFSTSNTGVGSHNLTRRPPSHATLNASIAVNKIPQNETVYFGYDSSTMTAEVKQSVSNHSKYLVANPDLRVILQGHADERGSREYNLGLGEKRAIAVQDLMVLAGVRPSQIFVISYGEEKPAVLGSGESVWKQNRRVEFIYR